MKVIVIESTLFKCKEKIKECITTKYQIQKDVQQFDDGWHKIKIKYANTLKWAEKSEFILDEEKATYISEWFGNILLSILGNKIVVVSEGKTDFILDQFDVQSVGVNDNEVYSKYKDDKKNHTQETITFLLNTFYLGQILKDEKDTLPPNIAEKITQQLPKITMSQALESFQDVLQESNIQFDFEIPRYSHKSEKDYWVMWNDIKSKDKINILDDNIEMKYKDVEIADVIIGRDTVLHGGRLATTGQIVKLARQILTSTLILESGVLQTDKRFTEINLSSEKFKMIMAIICDNKNWINKPKDELIMNQIINEQNLTSRLVVGTVISIIKRLEKDIKFYFLPIPAHKE